MRKPAAAFLLVSLIMAGCSPTTKRSINLSHTGKVPDAVALLPLQQGALTVINEKEFLDNFQAPSKGAEQSVRDTVYEHIARMLRKATKIPLISRKNADTGIILDSSNSFVLAIRETVESDSFLYSFRLPESELISRHFKGASVAIGISRIYIRNNVITVYNKPAMTFSNETPSVIVAGSNITSRTLEATMEYVVWDYASNQVVSFGESIVHAPVLVSPTRDNWITLFEKIGEQLLTHVNSQKESGNS